MKRSLIKTALEKQIDTFTIVLDLFALGFPIKDAIQFSQKFRCANCLTKIYNPKSTNHIVDEVIREFLNQEIRVGFRKNIIDKFTVTAQSHQILYDVITEVYSHSQVLEIYRKGSDLKLYPLKPICLSCYKQEMPHKVEKIVGEYNLAQLRTLPLCTAIESLLLVGRSSKLSECLRDSKELGVDHILLTSVVSGLEYEMQSKLKILAQSFSYYHTDLLIEHPKMSIDTKSRDRLHIESDEHLIAPYSAIPKYFSNKSIGEALRLDKVLIGIYEQSPDAKRRGAINRDSTWKGVKFGEIPNLSIGSIIEIFSSFPKIKPYSILLEMYDISSLKYSSSINELRHLAQWLVFSFYQATIIKKGSTVYFDWIDDELDFKDVEKLWAPIIALYKKRASVVVNMKYEENMSNWERHQ